jgi:hypothetical protein
MKKTILISIFLSVWVAFGQYTENDIRAYVEQYKELAIRKMYEYKIPASITIAQGIFESASGTSRLAKAGNNHFGIKCHKEWTGDTVKVDDDSLQECFRKYAKVEDSYNDHSLFLTSRPRYSKLFSLDIMDYKGWAKGLKEAGYATNPKYAERLISLIDRFELAKLDTIYQERMAKGWFEMSQPEMVLIEEEVVEEKEITLLKDNFGVVFTPNSSEYKKVNYPFSNRVAFENNGVLFVIAKNGDTYATIARDVQSDENRIRLFNDVPKGKGLVQGEIVYIEQKRKTCKAVVHVLEKGETLHYISQKYGVRLAVIMKINDLNEKSVVKVNSKIKLKKDRRFF